MKLASSTKAIHINNILKIKDIYIVDEKVKKQLKVIANKLDSNRHHDIGSYLHTAGIINDSQLSSLNKKGYVLINCFLYGHEDNHPSMNIKVASDKYDACIFCNCIGDRTIQLNVKKAYNQITFYELRALFEGSYNTTNTHNNNNNQTAINYQPKANLDTRKLANTIVNFYSQELLKKDTPEKQKALAYLEDRGVSLKSINKHKIGVCIDNSFSKYIKANYDLAESNKLFATAEEIGFINKYRYDFENNRLTMKYSHSAISGRCVPFLQTYTKGAKYLNSRNCDTFNKSQELFNYNNIKKSEYIIVVEGYYDCIAIDQFLDTVDTNISAVATITCNMSLEQAKAIKRKTDKVILSLDTDKYGQKGSLKAIEHLIDAGFSVENITLINDLEFEKDFSDWFRNKGLEHIELDNPIYNEERCLKKLTQTVSVIDFLITNLNSEFSRKEIEREKYDVTFKEYLYKYTPMASYEEILACSYIV